MTELTWALICLEMRDKRRKQEVMRQARKDASAIVRKIRRLIRSKLKERP